MMNHTYGNSISTIVYFGEGDQETEAAFEFARKLAAMKYWPKEKVHHLPGETTYRSAISWR
jgi:hypothetical protein